MADRIPFSEIGQYRQLALVRLLLGFTGHTHQWLLDYGDTAASILRRHYRNPADVPDVLNWLESAWNDAYAGWLDSFHEARRQAAALTFGELGLSHNHYMRPFQALQEARSPFPPVFEPQLQEVVEAAANRVHDDGFKLSQRIWRLDRQSFNGIRRTVMSGVSESKGAFQLAQDVEAYLGAGADCPRWTYQRLYGLTKADIAAGFATGLLTGSACTPERGVAYNALRLARTEIQFAHNEATRTIHERSPWVEQVKFNLSPAHPEPDICDEFAQGGPQGDGVYLSRELQYPPLHPHCLCFVTAVQMSDAEFTQRMRGWLNQTAVWPEMDSYAASIGRTRFNVSGVLAGLESTLYAWTLDVASEDFTQLRLFESEVSYAATA